MDRRDFLRAGVAGAGLGIAGCTPAAKTPPPGSPEAVEDFLRRVEHGRGAIAQSTPLADLFADRRRKGSPAPSAVNARDEQLFRKSLDAMFLAGAFRGLRPDEQVDPRVQRVMLDSLGDMNDAVLGVAGHLERLSKEEREAIGGKLRAEPDLAMDLFEEVDRKAALVEVDPVRRLQLRNLASQVGWRLRMQPVALFVDEHVAKVRILAERQNQELLDTIVKANPDEGRKGAGDVTMTVGAILLGCSIVLGGAGLLILSAGSIVGAFVVTAGVLGAVGGLVTLLVGLIIRATA